jgi:signal transduction histidine kinase
MRSIKMFSVLTMVALVFVSFACAEELTAKLCREKVNAAAELLSAEGEACFSKIADPNGSFIFGNGEGYVWIQDLNAKMILHPLKPALEGKSLMDMKDDAGNYIFVAFSAVAEENGSGWVPYVWPKAGTDVNSPKISYLKLVEKDGVQYVLGSGLYEVTPADIKAQFPDDVIYEY